MTAAELDLSALVGAVEGPVLRAGDPGWDEAVSGFNLAIVQRPDVLVGAASTADVVAALTFAADAGLAVSVRATGHGAAAPAESGLLIDTSRMDEVRIDPEARTATVCAGARWQQVIDAAAPHGLAPLNGSSPTVGVVGYTLGGGAGPMARTFGFAADRVRRLELVTATGELLQVDAEHEPELFWALRGGKCAVGVVTELEFELVPLTEYYGGGIYFAGDDATTVLHAWREWVTDLPDEATSSIGLLRLPDLPMLPEPLRGRLSVHLRYVYIGDADRGAELLAPMRATATPLIDAVALMPYSEIASVHNDPPEPVPAWDGGLALGGLPADAIDALLAAAGPGVDVPIVVAELRHLGGALAREPQSPNAISGRDVPFLACVIAPLPPPLAEIAPAAARGVIDALRPWGTGGCLINFQGQYHAPEDARRAWPSATRARLDAIERRYDPDGRLRFSHPTR
jgi:FAD/FMN-containing dehydrogenase